MIQDIRKPYGTYYVSREYNASMSYLCAYKFIRFSRLADVVICTLKKKKKNVRYVSIVFLIAAYREAFRVLLHRGFNHFKLVIID